MVIRIMVMVPLYAIASCISLLSLEAAFFIDAVRDIYEVSNWPWAAADSLGCCNHLRSRLVLQNIIQYFLLNSLASRHL
jgi:hypothetical protein